MDDVKHMAFDSAREEQGHGRLSWLPMAIKYLFSALAACATYLTVHRKGYVMVGLLELVAIAALTNLVARRSKVAANILNGILILMLNIQLAVMVFGSDWLNPMMLLSLNSIEDLSGNAVKYIAAAVAAIGLSFLPVRRIEIPHVSSTGVLSAALGAELVITMLLGPMFSPLFGWYSLVDRFAQRDEQSQRIAEALVDGGEFLEAGVGDEEAKPTALVDKPNVIVIFTEGLSTNVIEDERGIMPNARALIERSISFDNYFNHTFATYRALIGQLYSGHQFEDYEPNNLASLQSILGDEGYATAFINTEPYKEDYTEYLNQLGFDQVVTRTDEPMRGMANTLSDEQAYDLLRETVEQHHDAARPFLVCMYTFGTHVSLESSGEKFGDGSLRALNRFYNADVWLGKFIEWFESDPMFDDTILVFTADHAAYADADFIAAYPDFPRACTDLDEMPLAVYHKGIEPAVIDVGGRNTLGFAPTILDYLDVSAPNSFLGESLFGEPKGESLFDTTFWDPNFLRSTDGGQIAEVDEETAQRFYEELELYFAVKLQELAEAA